MSIAQPKRIDIPAWGGFALMVATAVIGSVITYTVNTVQGQGAINELRARDAFIESRLNENSERDKTRDQKLDSLITSLSDTNTKLAEVVGELRSGRGGR